jgi:maltose phosphorylase
MLAEHTAAWHSKWEEIDIVIEGDLMAQQGIRFNIFHLHQTYTGADNRLNIGPKGFTGEKYGGSTYWDTEAYCIPFYLSTADESVAKNLLMYRYNHLQKAIENAEKLGFNNGAALYPMVTMNGEECHNEWEITFEEIHRNGAIAYAIYDYVNYTGDCKYIEEYGIEVLIAIARFWSQRFQFSEQKKQFVMLGVTGPNEYENNVNNNFYTSYIARWCMDYTIQTIERLKKDNSERLNAILTATHFNAEKEISSWQFIIKNIYLPKDEKLGIYLQQEGFLDKEILPVAKLDPKHLPINQKWSWDRILRSCYIKQADVLQGIYFFEDQFEKEDIRRNFDFYEPITVHESSLSPCIHCILATHIGYKEKAYEMYIRTSRLDLDDINNEVCDGLHITSMAGTWISIVKGFGGMRIKNNKIHLNPTLPDSWTSFKFRLKFRGGIIECCVRRCSIEINNLGNKELELVIDEEFIISAPGSSQKVSFGESVLT